MGIVNRILLVCNSSTESGNAAKRMLDLAAATGARVTALSILPSLPTEFCRVSLSFDPEDLWNLALEERTADMRKWIEPLFQAGCSPELHVRRGPLFKTIVDEIRKGSHDLVILPNDVGMRRWRIFGRDISARLLERCPCSTWLLSPQLNGRLEHVAIFVSWPIVSPDDRALADKVVRLAVAAAPHARTFRIVLVSERRSASQQHRAADLLGVNWLSGAVAELASRGIPAHIEPAGDSKDALDRLLLDGSTDLLVAPASALPGTRRASNSAAARNPRSILVAVPDQALAIPSPENCVSPKDVAA